MSDLQKYEPKSTALSFPTDGEWQQMGQMASALVASGLFKSAANKNATVAILLKGRYMGVDPIFSVERIHAIPTQGGVTLSIDGQGMLAMIRREKSVKYHVTMENDSKMSDNTAAVCVMRREGDDEATVIRWTMADAKVAGLTNKQNWQKYPKAMLRWRTIVDAARIVCPDVIHGLYLADEMGAETDEDGAPIYDGNAVVVKETDLQSEAVDAESSPVVSDPDDLPLEKVNRPPQQEVEPPPPEQPEEPADDLFDATKKMAHEFRKMWGALISGFKVATELKVGKWSENSMLGLFARHHGVELPADEHGIFHVSGATEEQIRRLMASLKEPAKIELLKGFYQRLENGAPVPSDTQAPPDTQKAEEPPKQAEKPSVVEPEDIKKEIQDIQTGLGKEYGMDGIKIQATVLKKHDCVPGKKPTVQQLVAARDEMIQVAQRLLSEETKDILASLQ